jgi:hypothetical protein
MAAVQGKVAWNKQGNKTWSEANLLNLCRGTTRPAATIECFRGAIQANAPMENAIARCKAPEQAAAPAKAVAPQQAAAPAQAKAAPPAQVNPTVPKAPYGAPDAIARKLGAGGQQSNPRPAAADQYGAPPVDLKGRNPANQYDAPPVTGRTPANQYDAPPVTGKTPANQYGAPPVTGKTPANQYDAPPVTGRTPANQYGAPPVTGKTPATSEYGAAPKPGNANQYTPAPSRPNGNAPANEYGAAPKPGNANQYNKVGVGPDQGNYGELPVKPAGNANQYSAPPSPNNQYDRVPANQYEKVPANQYDKVPANQYDKVPANQYDKVPANQYDKVPANQYDKVPANQYDKVPANQYDKVPANQYDKVPANQYDKAGVKPNQSNYDDVPAKPASANQYNKVGVGPQEGNYGELPVKPAGNANQYNKVGVGPQEGNYGELPVKPAGNANQYNKVGVGPQEGNYGELPVKPAGNANQYTAPPGKASNEYGAAPKPGNANEYSAPPNSPSEKAPSSQYGAAPKPESANQYSAPPNSPSGKAPANEYGAAPHPEPTAGQGIVVGEESDFIVAPRPPAPAEKPALGGVGGVAVGGAAGLVTGAGVTAITEAASGQKVTIQNPANLKFVGSTNQPQSMCWRDSYPNGAGQTLGCASGLEKSGQLCYPPTQAGYYCVGTICGANCPSGFSDAGAFCQKPSPYGRGSGYAIWSQGQCNSDNPSVGCEQNGAMWYPRCQAGFHAVGCCVCSPDCPSRWGDTGTGCTKPTYTRGAGAPISACSAGMQQSGLLCYTPCKTGYQMVGPVCWDQKCPAAYPVQCGASCAVSSDACAISTESQVLTPIQVITNVIGIALTGGASAGAEVAAEAGAEGAETAAKTAAEAGISASLKAAAQKAGKNLSEAAVNSAASTFGSAEVSGTFDYYSLDPTGVASVVEAYDKPICNVPNN